MKKITARLKTAEEITGIKGCQEFHGDVWRYIKRFDELARLGQVQEFRDDDRMCIGSVYDYKFKNTSHFVKKEWLKDIRREVDWSKVPVDTKVIIRCEELKGNRYFAYFKEGKIHCFPDGRTSWSHYGGTSLWLYNPEYVELWEGED